MFDLPTYEKSPRPSRRKFHPKGPSISAMVPKYRFIYLAILAVFLFGILVTTILQFWPHSVESAASVSRERRSLDYESTEVVVPKTSPKARPADADCLFHTCFDVYHCGYNDENRITIYVYPPVKYVDEEGLPLTLPVSREFQEIVETVIDSVYWTNDPDKACLFLPSIDLLNQNNIRLEDTARILASLSRWNDGANHLLFNMLPGSTPDYNTTLDANHGQAILAGGGFNKLTYRRGYDVSIPVYNPLTAGVKLPDKKPEEERTHLLVAAQMGYHIEFRQELTTLSDRYPGKLLLLDRCEGTSSSNNMSQRCRGGDVYEYPHILQEAEFCLVIRGARLAQTALFDALKTGCIPIIVADGYVLPFSDVLDWKRASILLQEDYLGDVMTIVGNISRGHIVSMRRQGRFYYDQYFSSLSAITLTTLQILNDRVFPYDGKKYEEWNEIPYKPGVFNPLFLPVISPKNLGFTAVVLTYDRLETLFKVINRLALVPSLSKILVVWNNQLKAPPGANLWPKISKPLKVVQTRHNRLSNRFYPYDEIETECILAIDDDIVMLTPDEIEFGYEVWREFPDRLVGFPSRSHTWTPSGGFRYESEWMSNFSIVLTGAAFHHKYYSYMYTNSQPGNIKQFVDDQMNCEDIAMNFLITNITGKPPIKVAPRQKFKCPECAMTFMLSADQGHMVERSECITKFTQLYGQLPLKTIEFRADPVLYKDNVSNSLKRYTDLGSL